MPLFDFPSVPLKTLCENIIRLCHPREIRLFSQKQKPNGELSAVKLCVIIPEGSSREVEHRLYIEADSDIPFDVLVYTDEEWQKQLSSEMSFAGKIREQGRLLYASNEA